MKGQGTAFMILFCCTACVTAKRSDGEAVSVLLLMGQNYGANFMIDDEIPSIRKQFEGYGWEITTAAPEKVVSPCAWGKRNAGQKDFEVDLVIGKIRDLSRYDAVIVLPGRTQDDLINSPETIALLREAARRGMVVAAWCRGSRVLAAAGILDGVRVIGNPDFRREYEDTGALWTEFTSIEEAPPPISDRGIVTTLRSKYYRVDMCEEIRKAVETSVPRIAMAAPAPQEAVETAAFAFLAKLGEERAALLLAESIRAFGGVLKGSPIWIMTPADSPLRDTPERDRVIALGAEIVPYDADSKVMEFSLSDKVAAAAAAEARAEKLVNVLVWMDNDTIVLDEPSEFLLPVGTTFAARPVQILNIGSPYDDPIPPLWEALYRETGVVEENVYPMTTAVDGTRIRPYYNAGLLVVRPERRLLRTWYKELARLIRIPELKPLYARLSRGEFFFHQAVLASVIVSHVPATQIEDFPVSYNYQLPLHTRYPEESRPGSLNDIVTLRYDSLGNILGGAWNRSLHASDPLRSWLAERLGD